MRHPESGDVIEDGRNGRRLDDLGVGDVEVLGHDEGHGAHDRRHDLAAHRRGGLDGTGENTGVAEALHQRDGELAGGQHVGDAGARDGAHQPGGQHGHLGWAAFGMPDQPERQVVEEIDHAGVLEEGAEQDKQEDVGG